MRSLRVLWGAALVSAALAAGFLVASGSGQQPASSAHVMDRRCRGGCRDYPNLLTKSQNLSVAPWTLTTLTASFGAPGGIVAPDGTSTVTQLTPNAGATDSNANQVITDSTRGLFTASVWIRLASGNAGGSNLAIYFDDTGAQGGPVVITPTATWTRYSNVQTFSSTHAQKRLQIGGAATWPLAAGAYDVWGAQVQQGLIGPYRPVP